MLIFNYASSNELLAKRTPVVGGSQIRWGAVHLSIVDEMQQHKLGTLAYIGAVT
jgi:hypothetical protein